jgi:hypothetical protein
MSSDKIEKSKELFEEINKFNKKYIAYIDCRDKEMMTCTGKEYDNMMEVYNNISDESKGLIKQVYDADKMPILSENEFETKHTDIMKRYKTEVLPLRTELDTKLFELKDNDKSLKKEAAQYNELTMYSNMFLTVLATTGLYYFFFKLSK